MHTKTFITIFVMIMFANGDGSEKEICEVTCGLSCYDPCRLREFAQCYKPCAKMCDPSKGIAEGQERGLAIRQVMASNLQKDTEADEKNDARVSKNQNEPSPNIEAGIKEDPSLKPILDEIETGGPAAMMRYWNVKDVIQKLGEVMGLAATGDATTSAEQARNTF